MFKRFVPFAGAIALMVGVLAGCQDSPTTSPDTSNAYTVTGDEAYKAFELDATSLNDFSDIVAADQALDDALLLMSPPPDGDSLRGNPPGRDSLRRGPHPDSLRRGPRPDSLDNGRPDTNRRRHPRLGPPRKDRPTPPRRGDSTHDGRPDSVRNGGRPDSLGHLLPINYERIIKQLNLTPEQDALVRLCFTAYRDCSRDADARYRSARQGAAEAYQAAIAEIQRKVSAGEITREEARAQINALNATYRQQAGELERAYRSALDSCNSEFRSCVASHLTAEQLAVWERLTRR